MRRIIAAIALLSSICACSDITFGDKFLGDHPEESGVTLEELFSSATNADKVLTYAYRHLPYGIPVGERPNDKLGNNILECITDLHYSFRNNISDGPRNLYYNGALSANINAYIHQGREAYRFGSELEFYAIRYAWIYIENADKIPDINASGRASRIAEAKAIIALANSEMLRYVGGIPIIDHCIEASEAYDFPRASFNDSVEWIVGLLDEAIADLPWSRHETESGRFTKAGAMALKLRVLLFAASPLFNSDSKWHPNANEYTCYDGYDKERWKRAVDAGKAFFDELNRSKTYELVQAKDGSMQAKREAYRKAYLSRASTEVLISTRKGYSHQTLSKDFYAERMRSGATLNYVNMFPWADGTDFPENFDWANPSKQPFFTADAAHTPTRDPRLYETVVVPGDIYYDGTMAPLYFGATNYSEKRSGFAQMKHILQNDSDRTGEPAHWAYLRLPEAMLGYAEAINEYYGAPNAEAYDMVNQVRARVGLKPLAEGMTKDEFREAILRERALEFGYEEVRWFDLIRHKREKDFRKRLQGLESRLPAGESPNNPLYLEFVGAFDLDDRDWCKNWDTKWYLQPIPRQEIDKKYGMTQNPGW